MKQAGFRIRYVNFGREPESRPSLEGYEALIILGGPMNSDQIDEHPNLITEVEIIREAISRDMSVLGICLGAQLLAKALGGSVSRNATREIGWYDVELTSDGACDPVLSAFATSQPVFQWHEDGFQLPDETTRLATSDASNVQAFRPGYDPQANIGPGRRARGTEPGDVFALDRSLRNGWPAAEIAVALVKSARNRAIQAVLPA